MSAARQALRAFGDDWVRIQDAGSHFNLAVTSTSNPTFDERSEMHRHLPATPRSWCSPARPPHSRIDQCVSVALEEPMPRPPATLLTFSLADGLEHDIPAQQPMLLSEAISLVVIQTGFCVCHCGTHRPILPRRHVTESLRRLGGLAQVLHVFHGGLAGGLAQVPRAFLHAAVEGGRDLLAANAAPQVLREHASATKCYASAVSPESFTLSMAALVAVSPKSFTLLAVLVAISPRSFRLSVAVLVAVSPKSFTCSLRTWICE